MEKPEKRSGDSSSFSQAKRTRLNQSDSKCPDFLVFSAASPVAPEAFQALAGTLMNQYDLQIADRRYSLLELECYYNSPGHVDFFCHGHPIQWFAGRWYFHRQGRKYSTGYKGGNYKGLDITFGNDYRQWNQNASQEEIERERKINEFQGEEIYGGILIRTIRENGQEEKCGEIIEGCSLIVDHLLRVCSSSSIGDLVENRMGGSVEAFREDNLVKLTRKTENDRNNNSLPFASPRVGLSLKRVRGEFEAKFLFSPYRFTAGQFLPKKQTITILLGKLVEMFHRHGKSIGLAEFDEFPSDLISSEFPGVGKTRLANYFKEFLKGWEKSPKKKQKNEKNQGKNEEEDGEEDEILAEFYGKSLSTNEMARAYGRWTRKYGRQQSRKIEHQNQ